MKTKITKAEVIGVLEEMATLLELRDANVFKIRAFENAARALESHPSDLDTLMEEGKLEAIKGIGKGISAVIHDLYTKGESADYRDLRKGFPESLFEVLNIPGLGAKRVKVLYRELEIKSVAQLETACKKGKLRSLDGFGEKSEAKILKGIEQLKKSAGLYRIDFAKRQAGPLLAYLKKQPGVENIALAGSLRRAKEVIKDIDILVTAKNDKKIHEAFVSYPEVNSVVAHGDTKSSVTLKSGMACDLRTVKGDEFAAALYYFTGSKEHNVAVRTRAKKRGIKINEYGLFKGKKKIVCKDEAAIFKTLGLHYIPPEARENTGEVEWAERKPFPELVEEKDVKGIFHVHSTYSDGSAPLEAMVRRAEELGYDYVGISDHSQSAGYAHGLNAARLREQWKELDKIQQRVKIRIFRGIESDILGDGALDYPESILKEFDFIIGSVHSRFSMPEKEMERRFERALGNKYLTYVGHPTGRLILQRAPYAVNVEKLLAQAKKFDVGMELNANPFRLDLDWRMCQTAKKLGVKIGVHPDAHSLEGLEDMTYGIGIARKGWLEKKDVSNTMTADQIEKYLKRRR